TPPVWRGRSWSSFSFWYGKPSLNKRLPLPKNTGATHKRYSSNKFACMRDADKAPLPKTSILPSPACFSFGISTSASFTIVVLLQSAVFRLVEQTIFGSLFIYFAVSASSRSLSAVDQ